MKILPAILITILSIATLQAVTPEQEKAFIASYRKALEAGDSKTLESFLYTKGAPPEIVEFFKMMMTMPLPEGGKITSIELVTPSAEEAAKLNEPNEMPDGKVYKMPLKPIKQLVIVIDVKDSNGSSKNTSKSPVAEKDGKLVIPVPVPAK